MGFGQRGAVARSVMGGWAEGVLEGWGLDPEPHAERQGDDGAARTNGTAMKILPKGAATRTIPNGTYPDEADDGWGWEGGGKTDRMRLGALLDECLAIGQ